MKINVLDAAFAKPSARMKQLFRLRILMSSIQHLAPDACTTEPLFAKRFVPTTPSTKSKTAYIKSVWDYLIERIYVHKRS
jgi:hypothetical protein